LCADCCVNCVLVCNDCAVFVSYGDYRPESVLWELVVP
jgi:hypothetical protein